MARRPSGAAESLGQRATADPKALASLLGMLVFSSAAVVHGRTYMQGMLRQFSGLEVDWKRGVVRWSGRPWQQVELSPAFWRDLSWWNGALAAPRSVPLREAPLGEAAITGTDASDLACGELAWIDGAREEMNLVFTQAERRRPINFRELLGVYRLVERWGERLKRRTLLIDIDNTATVGATRAEFSKSEDMQELVRRLVELASQHSLVLRPVHTPGAMLHRPDQTSRGAAVEEPRLRFERSAFKALEALHGPFTELIGAEREFSRWVGDTPTETRMWAHPTFDTVASALARIGERLDPANPGGTRGLIVVPWAPEASWWPMLKHFTCVARFGVGSRHLEENRAGKWIRVSARRHSVVMSFPALLGTVVPLDSVVPEDEGNASALEEDSPTLPPGTLLYSTRSVPDEVAIGGGLHGCLYMLLAPYTGREAPECAEFIRRDRAPGPKGREFYCDLGDKARRGVSLDTGGRPYRPFASQLWVANHFASGQRPYKGKSALWSKVNFDFEAAEQMVRTRRNILNRAWAEQELQRDELTDELKEQVLRLLQVEPDEDQPMSRLDERREPSTPEVSSRPDGAESPSPGAVGSPPTGVVASPSRLSITGQPLVRSGYAGMKCAGCGQSFGDRTRRTKVTPGGVGMIHNSRRCLDKATAALELEAELTRAEAEAHEPDGLVGEETGSDTPAVVCGVCEDPGPRPNRRGSEQRRQQLRETISEMRKKRVRLCLDGRCGVTGEEEMVCLGRIDGQACQASLHGVACAQLKKGHARLGCFMCADCRVRKMRPGEDPAGAPAGARDIAMTTMLIQMSSGAEATGASYYDYMRLEREFMESIGGLAGGILPSDDPDVFISFMCWVVCAKNRALSLDTLVRTAGAVMTRTRGVNLTRRSDVKAVYEGLKEAHGEEATPRTAVTRIMIRHLLETVIPERGGDALVTARMLLMVALEVMFGIRVGEALSGGDFHGLLANFLVILQRLDEQAEPTGEETLEGMLEHSKTHNKRYLNAVATSKGPARVEFAKYLRTYWKLAGFTLRTRKEAGFLVTGPDYYVLRLSLVALTTSREGDVEKLNQVHRILKRSASSEARKWADYSLLRGGQRLSADSKDKRYVNLVGGVFGCDDINQVAREMTMAGLERSISVVPGPLMRSTHGKVLGFSHMPLQPSTTYDLLHQCLPRAYELANANSPDPELDLQGLAEPLWGHHSLRRGADTVARHTMHLTGATERDIDLLFGWSEYLYKKVMQLHYESNMERDRRSRVTSMM